MTAVLVALGAAIGAPLRYLVDRLLQSGEGVRFPRGTLLVNVAGSLILGVVAASLAGGGVGGDVMALVGTGFCGALTTYSTFGYETVRLAERGAVRLAMLNAAGSVALGLAAAAVGWWIGSALP